MAATADMYARTGNTSLYSLTAATQVLGGSGGTVSFELVLELLSNCATGAANLMTGDGNAEITFIDSTSGTPHDFYEHFGMFLANMYYRNSTITAALEQDLMVGSGSTEDDCFETQFGGCWSGIWATWPDLPFMWGKLQDNSANPYL
jgi:hypothetical protein